ncbi:MAG: hypothetical protein K0R61_4595 [Microvirga sp.]|nr:hypothetical protein [Microvirga sp.]
MVARGFRIRDFNTSLIKDTFMRMHKMKEAKHAT